MHTAGQQQTPQSGDQCKADGAGYIMQAIQECTNQIADPVAHRAKEAEGQRDHDQNGEQRSKNRGQKVRDVLFKEAFNITHCPGCQQHRNDGAAVIMQGARDAKHCKTGPLGSCQCNERGVNKHTAQQDAKDGGCAKFFRAGIADGDWQEVEACIAQEREQCIQITVRAEDVQHTLPEQGRHHLQQASHQQQRDQRSHTAGNAVENITKETLHRQLFLRLIQIFIDAGFLFKVTQCAQFVIDLRYVLTDHHLELPAGNNNAHHAADLFYFLFVWDRIVFQGKAQPGHAMCNLLNILFAANCFEHVFGDLFVGCHVKVLLRFPNDHNIRIDSS